MRPPTMPFGRHKGRPLDQLPSDYIWWLVTLDLRPPLRRHVALEYERRFGAAAADRSFPRDLRQVAHKVVTAGLHAVAKTAHPDAGGNSAVMRDVNVVVELLRRLIGDAA